MQSTVSTIMRLEGSTVDIAASPIFQEFEKLSKRYYSYDDYASYATRITQGLGEMASCNPARIYDLLRRHAGIQSSHTDLAKAIADHIIACGKASTLYILTACIVYMRRVASRFASRDKPHKDSVIFNGRDMYYDPLYRTVAACYRHNDLYGDERMPVARQLTALIDEVSHPPEQGGVLPDPWCVADQSEDQMASIELKMMCLMGRVLAMQGAPEAIHNMEVCLRLCSMTKDCLASNMVDRFVSGPGDKDVDVDSPIVTKEDESTASSDKDTTQPTDQTPQPKAGHHSPSPQWKDIDTTLIRIDGQKVDITTFPLYDHLTTQNLRHSNYDALADHVIQLIQALGAMPNDPVAIFNQVHSRRMFQYYQGLAESILSHVAKYGKVHTLYILAACVVHMRQRAGSVAAGNGPSDTDIMLNGVNLYYDPFYRTIVTCYGRGEGWNKQRMGVIRHIMELIDELSSEPDVTQLKAWGTTKNSNEEMLRLMARVLAMQGGVQMTVRSMRLSVQLCGWGPGCLKSDLLPAFLCGPYLPQPERTSNESAMVRFSDKVLSLAVDAVVTPDVVDKPSSTDTDRLTHLEAEVARLQQTVVGYERLVTRMDALEASKAEPVELAPTAVATLGGMVGAAVGAMTVDLNTRVATLERTMVFGSVSRR